ncbi:hypothetical protein F5Y10DRAFT_271998 [Nemania abortiva]|nr:hypothetical protein F5Y10DRAFT_271998 [Nemania abortiva]
MAKEYIIVLLAYAECLQWTRAVWAALTSSRPTCAAAIKATEIKEAYTEQICLVPWSHTIRNLVWTLRIISIQWPVTPAVAGKPRHGREWYSQRGRFMCEVRPRSLNMLRWTADEVESISGTSAAMVAMRDGNVLRGHDRGGCHVRGNHPCPLDIGFHSHVSGNICPSLVDVHSSDRGTRLSGRTIGTTVDTINTVLISTEHSTAAQSTADQSTAEPY